MDALPAGGIPRTRGWTLGQSCIVSTGLHLLLGSLILGGGLQGLGRTLPRDVYRVSLVALHSAPAPDPVPPAPAQTEPPAKPVPAPPKPPTKTPPAKPATPQPAEKSRPYVLNAKKQAPRPASAEADLQQHLRKALEQLRAEAPPAPPSGRGSDQSVFEATMERTSDILFDAYYSSLVETIRRNWVLPAGLPNCAELSADIALRIGPTGVLIHQWIERPSADSTFDYAALRAVMKSNPLPPPPASMGSQPVEVGFRFICS